MSASVSPLCSSTSTSTRKTALINPVSRFPAIISLLQICRNLRELNQIQAQLVLTGLLHRRPSAAGKLLESCISISATAHALSIFSQIDSPDVFAYNTMIRGLTISGSPYSSVLLYKEMLLSGLTADNYTYTFVLKACSFLGALPEGTQIHCRIIKEGISPDTHVHSSLIHMYATSNGLEQAEQVFDEFPGENTTIRNAMISGYFHCGCAEDARELFMGTVLKDVASWSGMVSGYVKNGMFMEALEGFREMTASGVMANESVVVSALSACGRLGALDEGRWIHAYHGKKVKGEMSVVLSTALIDMYAKCGSIEGSYEIFRKLKQRDVVTWCAMVLGFALHGQAEKALNLFAEMVAEGIHPNEAVFVAVLSACSHSGDVQKAHFYFDQMVKRYGIKPTVEHFGCLVDALCKAGRLAEAEELISTMPETPNAVIWGTLLSACWLHRDEQRGRRVFRHLIELEPDSGDRLKLMGHVFAATGNRDEAVKVRKQIKGSEMETTTGSSFIEVDGMVHQFVVSDICHEGATEIYATMEAVAKTILRAGDLSSGDEWVSDVQ